jgi:hypothetical protein
VTCVQRRSAHRIRRTTLVVGTGGAVRPNYPLLVRARPSVDRPDDRTSLRRSKVFPSLAGSRLSTAPCLGRHSLDPVTRGSTGVSVHRDFRSAPQSGSYGALVAPSTEMSRMTIYLADLLEGDGRASHLAPVRITAGRQTRAGHGRRARGARLTARRPLRAASVRSTSDSDRTGASR